MSSPICALQLIAILVYVFVIATTYIVHRVSWQFDTGNYECFIFQLVHYDIYTYGYYVMSGTPYIFANL